MCSQYMHLHMGDLPDDVIVSTSDSRMIGYDFLFQKHDHTLGNLLQTWLVEHHIEGNEEPKVTYAGYAVPHPLRDEMVLRIGVADRSELTARLAIATAAKGCVTMFKNLRAKWLEATGGK